MRGGCYLVATLLLTACMPDAGTREVTSYPISGPQLSVGVEDGDTVEMFSGAYTALLLADGSLAVANNGSHEIRIFDSAGQHLRTLGRGGSGPGEYRGYLTVYQGDDGRLAVFDAATQRVTSYSDDWSHTESTVAQGSGDETNTGPVWLYRTFYLTGPADPARRSAVARAIDGSGLSGFHGVLYGAGPCIWASLDGPYGSRWQVLGMDGEPAGEFEIPADAQLLQVTEQSLLLRRVDSLGVARFTVHQRPAALGCSAVVATVPSPAPRLGRAASPPDGFLVTLMMAQERHYADHSRYGAAAEALELPTLAYQVKMLIGDSRGYLAVAIMDDSICGLGVGYPTPPFWSEGIVYCS